MDLSATRGIACGLPPGTTRRCGRHPTLRGETPPTTLPGRRIRLARAHGDGQLLRLRLPAPLKDHRLGGAAPIEFLDRAGALAHGKGQNVIAMHEALEDLWRGVDDPSALPRPDGPHTNSPGLLRIVWRNVFFVPNDLSDR